MRKLLFLISILISFATEARTIKSYNNTHYMIDSTIVPKRSTTLNFYGQYVDIKTEHFSWRKEVVTQLLNGDNSNTPFASIEEFQEYMAILLADTLSGGGGLASVPANFHRAYFSGLLDGVTTGSTKVFQNDSSYHFLVTGLRYFVAGRRNYVAAGKYNLGFIPAPYQELVKDGVLADLTDGQTSPPNSGSAIMIPPMTSVYANVTQAVDAQAFTYYIIIEGYYLKQ